MAFDGFKNDKGALSLSGIGRWEVKETRSSQNLNGSKGLRIKFTASSVLIETLKEGGSLIKPPRRTRVTARRGVHPIFRPEEELENKIAAELYEKDQLKKKVLPVIAPLEPVALIPPSNKNEMDLILEDDFDV